MREDLPLEVVTEKSKLPIDELLEQTIGSFGRYQLLMLLLVFSPILCVAMQLMNWTFVASDQIYPGNSSIFEYWDIRPENRPQVKATVQAFYFVGQFVGSYVTGVMGDQYGRKCTMYVALFVQSVCGLLIAFAPNWWTFSALKLGTGFAQPALYGIPVLYGLEILGKSHRRLCAIALNAFYVTGMLTIPLASWLIRDQRHCHAALSVPSFVFMLYWWALPESPQWLVAKGRLDEADRVVKLAARMNSRSVPENWLSRLKTEENATKTPSNSSGIQALFKTPQMRKRMLSSTVIWPTISMLYFGLTMKSDLNGGSLYASFILSCVMELPGIVLTFLLINVIGRRLLISVSFFLCGVSLLLNWLFCSIAPSYVLLLFVLVCKIGATCVDDASYTHLPEMMPTLLRTTALGYCGAMSRIGAVMASYIAYWLVDSWGMVVLAVPFSLFSFASAGLVQFCLPETHGKTLPS